MGIASDPAKVGCGSLYHVYGKAVNITNDSRCLNTMLITGGEDGSISHIRHFRSRPSCWFHFYFDEIFFQSWATVYDTGPTLKQQTYASMIFFLFCFSICQHRRRWTNIESTYRMNVLRQLGFVTTIYRSDRVWASISFIMVITLTLM